MKEYQLIVIGAGPGGYEAAIRAAQLGLTTALIERRDVGGTCLNRGCIPTKAMLHSAQLYREAANFELFGLHTENTSFDWAKVHQRKNDVVVKLRTGIEQLIKANKIDFFNNSASILGKNDVQLDQGEVIRGENILIATGSVPARPPIPGLDLPNVVTSDELLDDPHFTQADSLAKEILIIGGGVIGVEFASVFLWLSCHHRGSYGAYPADHGSRNFPEPKYGAQKTRCQHPHRSDGRKAGAGRKRSGLPLYRKGQGTGCTGTAGSGCHRQTSQHTGIVCRRI